LFVEKDDKIRLETIFSVKFEELGDKTWPRKKKKFHVQTKGKKQ